MRPAIDTLISCPAAMHTGTNLQVFRSIVIALAIDMMHCFILFKRASQYLAHYLAMLTNISELISVWMCWVEDLDISASTPNTMSAAPQWMIRASDHFQFMRTDEGNRIATKLTISPICLLCDFCFPSTSAFTQAGRNFIGCRDVTVRQTFGFVSCQIVWVSIFVFWGRLNPFATATCALMPFHENIRVAYASNFQRQMFLAFGRLSPMAFQEAVNHSGTAAAFTCFHAAILA